jgi:hypothetical protein
MGNLTPYAVESQRTGVARADAALVVAGDIAAPRATVWAYLIPNIFREVA